MIFSKVGPKFVGVPGSCNLPKSAIKANCRFQMDIPNTKTPNPYNKWGFYNSTMAISTGFTVGLNVKNLFFSIRSDI